MKSIQLIAGSILIAWSLLAAAHSPLFMDYYQFDTSNGGESVPPRYDLRANSKSDQSARMGTPCVNGEAAGYPCKDIELMAFVAKADMGAGSTNLNDIWGWTDPVTGAEIALVGSENATLFVDVSDPLSPVYLGGLPTASGRDTWRDIKVYNDHAFIVADGFPNAAHGLQVFDLTQLRGVNPPVEFEATARLGQFGNAHNIAINEDTGYAYAVGSNLCSGGLFMVDISNPSDPTFVGCFSDDGYTHDAQCVLYAGPDSRYSGREICVAYNEDTITIVDVSDKQNPVQVSRTPYIGAQYTHQGWFLDDTHSQLIMNDELDERVAQSNTTSYLYDVSDLEAPTELGRYVGPTTAIDHNLYTRDGYVFQSNYRAGLRILDASDIANGNLTEVAFFDVIPNSDSPQFSGTWSNYIYFASGNIVLTDIGGGLFVVRPNLNDGVDASCLYNATFEESDEAWAVGGDCAAGSFTRGTPSEVIDSRLVTQPAGAAQGQSAWFTSANESVGDNDVDAGICETSSPLIDASGNAAVEVAYSYFLGQRDAGDDATDGLTIELLNDGQVVDKLAIGDVRNPAQWRERSSIVTAPGQLQVRVRARDGAGAGDLIEAGIDAVSVCAITPPAAPATDCSHRESFEAGASQWTRSGSCSAGQWTTGVPRGMSDGQLITQPDRASDGTNALYTGVNQSVGSEDVDGECVIQSSVMAVTGASTLAVDWFHGQRDSNDDAGDLFVLELSTDGGSEFTSLVDIGDTRQAASWQTATQAVAAGSEVVVRARCADAAGDGDLVECGLDNLRICSN